MATVEKITIALTPEMAGFVRQAVEAGEYASTSEAIRDAVREWKERRDLRGYRPMNCAEWCRRASTVVQALMWHAGGCEGRSPPPLRRCAAQRLTVLPILTRDHAQRCRGAVPR